MSKIRKETLRRVAQPMKPYKRAFWLSIRDRNGTILDVPIDLRYFLQSHLTPTIIYIKY